jgi:uncharacterized protein
MIPESPGLWLPVAEKILTSKPLAISKTTAQRFVLGRQGLWPGRRWAGLEGTIEALRTAEAVQMDPLNVVARSHDIVLWSRVVGYQPEFLDRLLYQERAFFDYGGGLHIYPMEELPYWRVHMGLRAANGRWGRYGEENTALIEEVRAELREHGPLGNRDFNGRNRINDYRGSKDSALALYYLWLTGELMIHHRAGFERVYDFSQHIAPDEFNFAASEQQAEKYCAHKAVAIKGMITLRPWKDYFSNFLQRSVGLIEARQRLGVLVQAGELSLVEIEGSKEQWYVLAEDLPWLEVVETGKVPPEWQPINTTSQEEVVFLAPLDIVSARGRANWLFDFEYVWEVYKPAAKRRWGYYTLPVLYGDSLVARLDPKLDRTGGRLLINGFWLEDSMLGADPDFAAALGHGLENFCQYLQVQRIDIAAINPQHLQHRIHAALEDRLEVQAAL